MTIGRNDSCPCGSGNKYKKCCLQKEAAARAAATPAAAAGAIKPALGTSAAAAPSSTFKPNAHPAPPRAAPRRRKSI